MRLAASRLTSSLAASGVTRPGLDWAGPRPCPRDARGGADPVPPDRGSGRPLSSSRQRPPGPPRPALVAPLVHPVRGLGDSTGNRVPRRATKERSPVPRWAAAARTQPGGDFTVLAGSSGSPRSAKANL
jgi:hypothetical protein